MDNERPSDGTRNGNVGRGTGGRQNPAIERIWNRSRLREELLDLEERLWAVANDALGAGNAFGWDAAIFGFGPIELNEGTIVESGREFADFSFVVSVTFGLRLWPKISD